MDRQEITAEEMRKLIKGMFKSNLGLKHFQDYMDNPNDKSLKTFVNQITLLKKTLAKMFFEYSAVSGAARYTKDKAYFFISEQGEDILFGNVKVKDFGTPESDVVLINKRFLALLKEFYKRITEAGYEMEVNLGYRYYHRQSGWRVGHVMGKAIDFSLLKDGRLANHIGIHDFLENTVDSLEVKSALRIYRKFVHLQLSASPAHKVIFNNDPTSYCYEGLVPVGSGQSR